MSKPERPTCPCCCASQRYTKQPGPELVQSESARAILRECKKCGAVYTPGSRTLYLGESYGVVLPYFDKNPSLTGTRYFDMLCLGSEGVQRRHGWFRPETRRVVQIG